MKVQNERISMLGIHFTKEKHAELLKQSDNMSKQ